MGGRIRQYSVVDTLRFIDMMGFVTKQDLKQYWKRGRKTIYGRIQYLKNAGYIEEIVDGEYQLTDKGKEVVKKVEE